jgi:hypothetical protein
MRAKRLIRRTALMTPAWRLFEPRFVITGAGRSGTRFVAELLRACGIRAGHEDWWNWLGNRSLRLDGDVSWLAAWNVEGFHGPVLNQLRDPIRVIGSYAQAHRRKGYDGDPIEYALRVTVERMRKAAEVSHWSWRVEDMDVPLLAEICRRVGFPDAAKHAETAIAMVPAGMGSHPKEPLAWDDLPKSSLKNEAQEIARHYGYL